MNILNATFVTDPSILVVCSALLSLLSDYRDTLFI